MPSPSPDEFKYVMANIFVHFGERNITFDWRGYNFTSTSSSKGYTKRILRNSRDQFIYSYEWLSPDLEDMHRVSRVPNRVSAENLKSWLTDTQMGSSGCVDIDFFSGSTSYDQLAEIVERLDEIGCGPVERLVIHEVFSERRDTVAFRVTQRPPFPQIGVATVPCGMLRVLPSGVLAINGQHGPTLLDIPEAALEQPSAAWLWDVMFA